MRKTASIVVLLLVLSTVVGSSRSVASAEFGTFPFERVWSRTDRPVADQRVSRTWVWGPEPFTEVILEPYREGDAAGTRGSRRVQYFDKARMEITHSDTNPDDPSYVTSGLLARELITGRMQLGDQLFVDYDPARIVLLGNAADRTAIRYETLSRVTDFRPIPLGWAVTQILAPGGTVADEPALARFTVTAAHLVPETNHTVASVFWQFMTANDTIHDGREFREGPLFDNPLEATGHPMTEPYWVMITREGVTRPVLVQAFERRVLTYSPDNPREWQVEVVNVGRHYYEWRYGSAPNAALTAQGLFIRWDSERNWVFTGEVVNSGRSPRSGVQVEIDLVTNSGRIVASQASYLDTPLLAPGARFPFRVWFETGQPFDAYQIRVGGEINVWQRANLPSRATQNGEATPGNGYRIWGQVMNETGSPVDRAQVVVALYDTTGRVIDYAWEQVSPSRLGPGESGAFEVRFYRTAATVSSSRVFVTG